MFLKFNLFVFFVPLGGLIFPQLSALRTTVVGAQPLVTPTTPPQPALFPSSVSKRQKIRRGDDNGVAGSCCPLTALRQRVSPRSLCSVHGVSVTVTNEDDGGKTTGESDRNQARRWVKCGVKMDKLGSKG